MFVTIRFRIFCFPISGLRNLNIKIYKTKILSVIFIIVKPDLLYQEENIFEVLRVEEKESKLSPLGTSATNWHVVPVPGDCEDGVFGGNENWQGNRSTRRKPAPAPLFSLQIPLDHTRAQTRAVAVGSQRLTAWAMARPFICEQSAEKNMWTQVSGRRMELKWR
jgi:hypothetical protein